MYHFANSESEVFFFFSLSLMHLHLYMQITTKPVKHLLSLSHSSSSHSQRVEQWQGQVSPDTRAGSSSVFPGMDLPQPAAAVVGSCQRGPLQENQGLPGLPTLRLPSPTQPSTGPTASAAHVLRAQVSVYFEPLAIYCVIFCGYDSCVSIVARLLLTSRSH